MKKRTLYISDTSYDQVVWLSQSLKTSHAEILRKAVEEGLKKLDAPPATPAPTHLLKPVVISEDLSENKSIFQTIRSLFK